MNDAIAAFILAGWSLTIRQHNERPGLYVAELIEFADGVLGDGYYSAVAESPDEALFILGGSL